MLWLRVVMQDLLCCIMETTFRFSRFFNMLKEERKQLIHSIKHGPYVIRMIQDGYVFRMIQDGDNTRFQTKDDFSADEMNQYEADIGLKDLIFYGLSNDIYNAIDSNQFGHDLWKALERLIARCRCGYSNSKDTCVVKLQVFPATTG